MSGAKLAATRDGALSTFLLEMALDEARLRERFAMALLEWRTRRGHGDPQRFPQMQAAAELATGYRTYQSWEAGDHLPRRWSDVERVLEAIGIEPAVLFDGEQPVPAAPPLDDDDAVTRHREIVERLERIEDQLRQIAVSAGAGVDR